MNLIGVREQYGLRMYRLLLDEPPAVGVAVPDTERNPPIGFFPSVPFATAASVDEGVRRIASSTLPLLLMPS